MSHLSLASIPTRKTKSVNKKATKLLAHFHSHVKLERELVEKSKVQLQEKISKEGKEFLDKRDQAVAQKQRVSVRFPVI